MGHVLVDRSQHRPGAAVLRFAVAGLTFLFVLALAGLVVVEVHPSWLAGLRNAPRSPVLGNPAVSTRGSRPTGVTSTGGPGGSATTGAGGGTSPVPAGSGTAGTPVLASIEPTAGTAGARVQLTGRNLFSPDGLLELSFAGHPAHVRCPTEQRCIATVPRLDGGPRPTRVTLATARGRSNALTFAYR